MDLNAEFSNLSEGDNYFVALFNDTLAFSPGSQDFDLYLQTHSASMQTRVDGKNSAVLEHYGYQSGDMVYVQFIPQARAFGKKRYTDGF